MKKLILKTALITFGVTLILAISIFGIVSFCAPSAMMKLTASLGLENISGDYAYQEYQHSMEIGYLAQAFEIAAKNRSDKKADEWFEELTARDGFEAYCVEQDKFYAEHGGELDFAYRSYLFGQAACVKYRLARTEEQKEGACEFAVNETQSSFDAGNPVVALTRELKDSEDVASMELLLGILREETRFEQNEDYRDIVTILEGASDE